MSNEQEAQSRALEVIYKSEFITLPPTFYYDELVVTDTHNFISLDPKGILGSLQKKLETYPSPSDERFWEYIVSSSRKLERHKRPGFKQGAAYQHLLVKQQFPYDETYLPEINETTIKTTEAAINSQSSVVMPTVIESSTDTSNTVPSNTDIQTTANLLRLYERLVKEQPALAHLGVDPRRAKDRPFIMGFTTAHYVYRVADWLVTFAREDSIRRDILLQREAPFTIDPEIVSNAAFLIFPNHREVNSELEQQISSSEEPSDQLLMFFMNAFIADFPCDDPQDIKDGAIMMHRIISEQLTYNNQQAIIPIEQPHLTNASLRISYELLLHAMKKQIPKILKRKIEQTQRNLYNYLAETNATRPGEEVTEELKLDLELKKLLKLKADTIMAGEWPVYETFQDLYTQLKKEQPALERLALSNENLPHNQRFIIGLVMTYFMYKYAAIFPPIPEPDDQSS